MNDIYIRYDNFPTTVNAFTIKDENSDYNIYVNSNCGHNCQIQAIQHELQHIKENDFESVERVCLIEIRLDDFFS